MNRRTVVLFVFVATLLFALKVWTATPPKERLDLLGGQTGVSFPATVQVVEGQPLTVTVVDPTKLLKILSMDRNFAKGEKIQVKFTGTDSAMMMLPNINKVAVFTFAAGKWQFKRLDMASVWQQ